jgi:hypothetical protein
LYRDVGLACSGHDLCVEHLECHSEHTLAHILLLLGDPLDYIVLDQGEVAYLPGSLAYGGPSTSPPGYGAAANGCGPICGRSQPRTSVVTRMFNGTPGAGKDAAERAPNGASGAA